MSEPGTITPELPRAARVDQYVGLWAMYEPAFRNAVNGIAAVDLHVHVAEGLAARKSDKGAESKPYQITKGGVAIIEFNGAMTKYGSSFSAFPGSVRMRRTIRQAGADQAVQAIVLQMHSPGGTVAGTGDLAADVRQIAERMPVVAFIEDMGASAAYWVASQAGSIVATESAEVGSIGTYAVIDDWHQFYEAKGITTYVIRAGEFKGAGVEGAKITDEQRAEWQREVDALNDVFLGAVARGRGMSRERIRELADGRVHVGQAAVGLGLADSVGDLDGVVAELEQALADGLIADANASARTAVAGNKETNMSKELDAGTAVEEPKAATVAELKAAFPNSDAEFRESCQETGCTLEQAGARWTEQVEARNKELGEQSTELKQQVEDLEGKLAKAEAAAKNQTATEGGEAVETEAGLADAGDVDDERLKAEYAGSAQLQAEFGQLGGFDAFKNWKQAEARGAARIKA